MASCYVRNHGYVIASCLAACESRLFVGSKYHDSILLDLISTSEGPAGQNILAGIGDLGADKTGRLRVSSLFY